MTKAARRAPLSCKRNRRIAARQQGPDHDEEERNFLEDQSRDEAEAERVLNGHPWGWSLTANKKPSQQPARHDQQSEADGKGEMRYGKR